MVRTTILAAALLIAAAVASAQPGPIAHFPLFSDGVDVTGSAGFSGYYLSPQSIIIGGNNYRWVGASVDELGQLYTLHNNSNHTPTGTTLQLDTWYNLVLTYDGAQDALKVYAAAEVPVATQPTTWSRIKALY